MLGEQNGTIENPCLSVAYNQEGKEVEIKKTGPSNNKAGEGHDVACHATCNPRPDLTGLSLYREGFPCLGGMKGRETQCFSFSNIMYIELLVSVCNFVIALRNDMKKRKPTQQLQIDSAALKEPTEMTCMK